MLFLKYRNFNFITSFFLCYLFHCLYLRKFFFIFIPGKKNLFSPSTLGFVVYTKLCDRSTGMLEVKRLP